MSTLRPVYWNDQTIMPLDMDINQLLYAIRQGDNGLILDSCSFADIYEDSDGVLGLDAMVTPFAYIERKMAAMRRVLDAQGGTLKVDDMAISDPFTGNGTVNVVVRFVLSDGQTISVYFHNPDTTPKKVLPTDEMISWKWLINKKDVTIVVAPEKGVDLNVRQVCMRLMKLAEKNSPAFTRANTKVAENATKKAALQDEITTLGSELVTVKAELDGLIAQKESGGVPLATTKLRNGTVVYADNGEPLPFATENLAKIRADQLGGTVYKMPRSGVFYVMPGQEVVESIPINEESAKAAFSNYEYALKKVQKGSPTKATGKDLTVAKKDYEKAKDELNKYGQWMLDKANGVLSQVKTSVHLPVGYETRLSDDSGTAFIAGNIRTPSSVSLYIDKTGADPGDDNQFTVEVRVFANKPSAVVFFREWNQPFNSSIASAQTYDELAPIIITALNNAIDNIKTPPQETNEQENQQAEEAGAKTTGKIETLEGLVAIALSRKDGNKAFTEIGEVSTNVADRVKTATGIDVSGWVHGIDEAAIRHILKQHGDPAFEASRGQIAVTLQDINNIKEIVENPDAVEKGGALPDGTETVVYKKTINDTVIYVQEIREGRNKLAAKTLWKVPVAPPAASDKSDGLVHTSETFNAHSPQGDESIAQPAENAIGPDQLAAGIDGEAVREGQETEELTPDGLDNEVKTAKGTKVVTGFMVIEASKLIISHDEQGNANPDYPAELQPRDRARDTSQLQITKIANNLDPDMLGRTRVAYQGAPIVGKDGVVESGNGRAMGITLAYKLGKADEYRAWLLEVADMYGLSETKIKAMKRPVLVRVRKTEIDRVQFAMESNQSDMLAMTGTEKAKSDANRLTDAIIGKLSIDGDLTAASNRDFIAAFLQALGDDETAGLLTTSGQPTKQLYDRAQAAIFAKAYNDDRLLELMADDSKPEIGNIIKSLNQAARPFIRARAISDKVTHDTTQQIGDAIQISLDQQAVDAIVKATEMLKKAKDSGMPIEELVKQGDLFGDTDPVVAQMALFIKDNNRSAARMGVAFEEMANFVLAELENRQNNSLFVDDPLINMVDVLKAANAQLQKQYGGDVKDIGGGTGGFIDLFTETRGQKADREAFLQSQGEQVETEPTPIAAPQAESPQAQDNVAAENSTTWVDFYGKYQDRPQIGDTIERGGRKFKITGMSVHILTSKDISTEDDFGQGGMKVGDEKITFNGIDVTTKQDIDDLSQYQKQQEITRAEKEQ